MKEEKSLSLGEAQKYLEQVTKELKAAQNEFNKAKLNLAKANETHINASINLNKEFEVICSKTRVLPIELLK